MAALFCFLLKKIFTFFVFFVSFVVKALYFA